MLMITDNVFLSVLIGALVLIVFMYLGRLPVRRAIAALFGVLHGACRVAAHTIQRGEQYLAQRNREVLLAAGREAKERVIEREFDRISATVDRDLSRYPETERRLTESIQRIDDDHLNSTGVPPDVPGWTKAVEAVAKVAEKSDPVVRDVLKAIHGALSKAQKNSLEMYRNACKERHRLLSRMMPEWRGLQHALKGMDRSVASLLERSRSIDRHMSDYHDIVCGSDRALHQLSTSNLTQFFISSFVIAIALGGAVINFSLIARPMSEMVGGTAFIGAFRISDIAALVIILVEISMGLFLMECLRITRLFPIISALSDKIRTRMMWITLFILTSLATVEAGLAYMREILMQDELATSALLRGNDGGLANDALWITTAAQMGMGFILPFALTFVAIPLETFIHSFRTVLGTIVIGLLRGIASVLRIVGNMFRQVGKLLLHLYDVVIFAPLWVETKLHASREARAKSAQSNYEEASV